MSQGDLLGGGADTLLTQEQERKRLAARDARTEKALAALGDLFSSPEVKFDEAAARRLVEQELARRGLARIEVVNRNQIVSQIEGHFHPNFPTLCRLAASFGNDGYVPGIWLAGEASSGKTYACGQLAKALRLPFRFNGAISMPHEMLGFIDGAGVYHTTPFRLAYEFGGVYCFDECDRSNPKALLCVNPHLANGIAEFPDKQVTRHPDCLIIATGNTWGSGPDAKYVGATKLDAAFLSRFPQRLPWNIDLDFERAIVANDNWCARVQAARKRAAAAGLQVMIDSRIALAGAAQIRAGATSDEAAQFTYLSNLKAEQVAMIEGVAA